MARSRCARRMGLLVSLMAPVRECCDMAAAHVSEGVGMLAQGTGPIGEWLDVVCPHGMHDGWINITWREGPDRRLWARIRFGVDGVPRLGQVSVAPHADPSCGYGYAADDSIAVVSIVGSADVPYSLGQAMAWVLSLGSSEQRPLGAGAAPSPKKVMAVDAQDMATADGVIPCVNGIDPERN